MYPRCDINTYDVQCFFLVRNIVQVTLENIYFYYLKCTLCWIKVSEKLVHSILKKEAWMTSLSLILRLIQADKCMFVVPPITANNRVTVSGFFLVETSVSSPRELLIFIIYKKIFSG